MNPKEYKELCKRTESPNYLNVPKDVLHGAMGCCTEAGELMDTLKKSMFYGRVLDRTNIIEELGDLSWYMSQVMNALGIEWEEVWDKNIDKLKVRYPKQFNEDDAINRNLRKEREELE